MQPPKETDFDRMFLVLAAACTTALIGFWMMWYNAGPAARFYMLLSDGVEINGEMIYLKSITPNKRGYEVNNDYAYKYIGPDGVQHKRDINLNYVWLKKYSDGQSITVLFNPKYPQFFALKSEMHGLWGKLNLFLWATLAVLLSGIIAVWSSKKYFKNSSLQKYFYTENY